MNRDTSLTCHSHAMRKFQSRGRKKSEEGKGDRVKDAHTACIGLMPVPPFFSLSRARSLCMSSDIERAFL